AARWSGPLVGFAAGVLGGMSAMFGPPMIAYLVGRRTDPDSFVKQMAIFAFTASLTMLLALNRSGSMSLEDIGISALAIIPILAGMPLGRWLRRRTRPAWFRAAVLIVLAAGGVDMLRRALF
ncbi:MAG TPA: TSUP family transporter, partial [Stellaceae bacterium]|nr:TSUP family transporter [Stellaceae bacterium]